VHVHVHVSMGLHVHVHLPAPSRWSVRDIALRLVEIAMASRSQRFCSALPWRDGCPFRRCPGSSVTLVCSLFATRSITSWSSSKRAKDGSFGACDRRAVTASRSSRLKLQLPAFAPPSSPSLQ